KARLSITEIATTSKQAKQFQITVADLGDLPEGDSGEVWLLITEKGLRSQVKAGENAGKNLEHASVVRWMRKVGVANGKGAPPFFSGESTVKFKPSWNTQNLRAVAFLPARPTTHPPGGTSLPTPHPPLLNTPSPPSS